MIAIRGEDGGFSERGAMKPVYFPFTYINDTAARNIFACFGQVTVYQPIANKIPENMKMLADEGILDLKVPVSGDEEKIMALIREYEEWGELHQKNDMAFLKAIGERIPFFDETSPTELASQIKKIRNEEYPEEVPDILFNARLFLRLAQDYDIMQEGINRDLVSVHEMEKKLLAGLTHEDEIIFAKKTGDYLEADDPGRYKIRERLEAWTYLMSNDSDKPRFFVTCNRDVFDFTIEKTGDAENIIEIDPFKICDYSSLKKPDYETPLKLSGIINKSRTCFINKILERNFQDNMFENKGDTNRSILVCLSEMPCLSY
jgi:hypothetical protein